MITDDRIIKIDESYSDISFDTLGDRMNFYRDKSNFRFEKNNYVMVMLDGKNFSTKIKKRFKLPFDDKFIEIMNDTAAFICSQVQGSKLAYVQSDEISIILTDFETPETTAYYDYRICKILSVIPSMAAAYFNREIDKWVAETQVPDNCDIKTSYVDLLNKENLYFFDCKAWILPTFNDVYAWYQYRQNDCIRNSKQQAAQTYLFHNQLRKHTADEQIAMLKEHYNIDWNTDYDDGKKYGRLVYKENINKEVEWNGKVVPCIRSVWKSHYAPVLNTPEGKQQFINLNIIPIK